VYLTLEQNRFLAPIAQEASFGFLRCPVTPPPASSSGP
jgi:hypothetical protein